MKVVIETITYADFGTHSDIRTLHFKLTQNELSPFSQNRKSFLDFFSEQNFIKADYYRLYKNVLFQVIQHKKTSHKPEQWFQILLDKKATIKLTIYNFENYINKYIHPAFKDYHGMIQFTKCNGTIKYIYNKTFRIFSNCDYYNSCNIVDGNTITLQMSFTKIPKNGKKIVRIICSQNKNVKKILKPFFGKGLSVHLINTNSCGYSSLGEHDIYDTIQKWDIKNWNTFDIIDIVYPQHKPLLFENGLQIREQILQNESFEKNEPTLSQKPFLILLDVDGVINSEKATNKIKVMAGFGNGQITVKYESFVVDAINTWLTKSNIMWLTFWTNMARYRLAPLLGIYDFPVAPFFKNNVRQYSDIVNYNVIWIDDDLYSKYEPLQECADQLEKITSLVRICPKNGLTYSDIKMVNDILGI